MDIVSDPNAGLTAIVLLQTSLEWNMVKIEGKKRNNREDRSKG